MRDTGDAVANNFPIVGYRDCPRASLRLDCDRNGGDNLPKIYGTIPRLSDI